MSSTTYTTQTEASTFAEIFNRVNGKGRTAFYERVGHGEYRVSIQECPDSISFFFGAGEK